MVGDRLSVQVFFRVVVAVRVVALLVLLLLRCRSYFVLFVLFGWQMAKVVLLFSDANTPESLQEIWDMIEYRRLLPMCVDILFSNFKFMSLGLSSLSFN